MHFSRTTSAKDTGMTKRDNELYATIIWGKGSNNHVLAIVIMNRAVEFSTTGMAPPSTTTDPASRSTS